jgi:acetyl-CoA/propionyl-CoA carboxylase biotin carboxyl carrier protein
MPANFGVPTGIVTKPSSPGPKRTAKKSGPTAAGDALTSPMQGTVVKIAVNEGQHVEQGELVVVLEAMKMEQPLIAHKSGVITRLQVTVGATIANGGTLCEIK